MAENTNKETTETLRETVERLSWFIRPCQIYRREYNVCTSFKGRFHQYFVDGKFADCSEWQKNYKDCYRWKNDDDQIAGIRIIDSERKLKLNRLQSRVDNDVWEQREGPPDNWASPLPDFLQERYKDSFLNETKSSRSRSCSIV